MTRHIVMWKFRQGTEAEQEQFLSGLAALQGVVPQLLRNEVKRSVGEGNYDAVLLSEFESLETLEQYRLTPATRLSPPCASPSGPIGWQWITNFDTDRPDAFASGLCFVQRYPFLKRYTAK